ncbi:MAG: hypothetical protein AVDCRST_MAG56-8082, partial [uncultured Cytophagales bacterium]
DLFPFVCRHSCGGCVAGRCRRLLADRRLAERPVRPPRAGGAVARAAERPAGVRGRHRGGQREQSGSRPGQPHGQPQSGV